MRKERDEVRNRLRSARTRAGLSQQQLAQAAGVTRQTVGGIEAGQYAPTAAVALRLARTLGSRVEDLFWLEEDLPTVQAIPANPAAFKGQSPVRTALARVGERWIAYPLIGEAAFRQEMIPADGIVEGDTDDTIDVRLLDEQAGVQRTVALAGCTPALSLWARSAERWHPGLRVHWMHANSTEALEALAQGLVHAAGIHVHDDTSGVDNLPFVRQTLAGRASVALIHLGVWEEGMLVAPGNPKGIRGVADLARPDVTLLNRESGAGARMLLDQMLTVESVPTTAITGYKTEARGHIAVANAVAAGRADVAVSTSGVAALSGLAFVPLRRVRYDLAVREEFLAEESVRQLLETLELRWVRLQLQVSGGYDTERTGEIVGEVSRNLSPE